MGLGDEIMASGRARELALRTGLKVCIVDKAGRPRWSPLWDGNPRLTRVPAGAALLEDGPNRRPYLASITPERMVHRAYTPIPGELWPTPGEASFGARNAGLVVVEPNLKPTASPNKQWGWERWQALVEALPALPWAQLGPPGTRLLKGVRHVVTPDFRQAFMVVWRARFLVVPDGALHHAAGACGVPAVVIYGAFVGPRNLGYVDDWPIYRPHRPNGEPCGARQACADCAAAMAGIGVDEVSAAIRKLMEDRAA